MSPATVVDSHIHFWDPQRLHYDWLGGELSRPFRPEDVGLGSVPVEAFVVVEADCRPSESLAEVEWVLSLSSPDRPITAVVAAAALERPSGPAEVEALARRPEVRGVRRLLQDTQPGFCGQPGFVRGVRSLARWNLTFDLCVRHHQLAEVAMLAAQCPEVTFVLDHLGKPQVGRRPDRAWSNDIERLAALPNTRCKLSGLTTEVLDPMAMAGRRTLFRPYLQHALQAFGPHRCLFGSDWPVSSSTVTYEGWFDHVVDAMHGYSSAETGRVLGGTAREVYRIGSAHGGATAPTSTTADAKVPKVPKVPTVPDRTGGGELTWR